MVSGHPFSIDARLQGVSPRVYVGRGWGLLLCLASVRSLADQLYGALSCEGVRLSVRATASVAYELNKVISAQYTVF